MINYLIRLLKYASITVDHRNLADSLWLAQYLPGPITESTDLVKETRHLLPVIESHNVVNMSLVSTNLTSTKAESAIPPVDRPAHDLIPKQLSTPEPVTELKKVNLYSVAEARSASKGWPVTKTQVPSGRALPNASSITQVLRPLHRRFPSRRLLIMDDKATAQKIAGGGPVTPMLRPKPERWFQAVLVVEESPSITIWKRTIVEFRLLLEHLGAFSDVRSWSLHVKDKSITLHSPSGERRSPQELKGLAARRLIFLIADCVSASWREGAFIKLIEQWADTASVVIVQLLPERLWARTALGRPSVRVISFFPGVSNRHITVVDKPWWDCEPLGFRVPVPIVTLEPSTMARWARMIMASGMSAPAILIGPSLDDRDDKNIIDQGTLAQTNLISPEQRVQRFRALVSPTSFKLAVYFTVVHLTLPIMRLVQHTMLETSHQVHLAEVLLGGIIERVTPADATCSPDDVVYDFYEGVRDLLQTSLLWDQAETIIEVVSKFLERQMKKPVHLDALITDPEGEEIVPQEARPFARIAAEFFKKRNAGLSPFSAPTYNSTKQVMSIIHENVQKMQDSAEGWSRDDDTITFRRIVLHHLVHTVGKDELSSKGSDWYYAVARAVRDLITEGLMESTSAVYRTDAKRVYYLCTEFLPGQMLKANLIQIGYYDRCIEALSKIGIDLEQIARWEVEAALGWSGLGHLTACLLESMGTVGIPAYGYGIRYDFGVFLQYIKNGQQIEMPNNWLRYGNPWEFIRTEVSFPVRFFGQVFSYRDESGRLCHQWTDTEQVQAIAYDQGIPGYNAWSVNNIRLWRATSAHEFNLKRFYQDDFAEAVRDRSESESLSRMLYPDDSTLLGRRLRLKQEYFFVSASLQDILRRFLSQHKDLTGFPDKVAIQLNDIHPAIAIPELIRLLMDVHGLTWEQAWDISVRTFAYTNHMLLPEALETWPVQFFETILPRHLQIIYEINHRFLEQVRRRYPGDVDLTRRVSLIDESGERRVRMAHLAFVGSHKVNGVARVHTELMKSTIFADFHRIFPDRIVNVTNGITPRRWLNQCNQPLAALICNYIGKSWITDLSELRQIERYAVDPEFQSAFRAIKRHNKYRLGRWIEDRLGITIDNETMFDIDAKDFHERKRQLLNVLHVITRYNRILANPSTDIVPRTILFAGKAMSNDDIAKLTIRLINDLAYVVNHDPAVKGKLEVLFLPNYNISLAELIIPAADLSEQISAPGTGAPAISNMKMALNGALTIGTCDGTNIEIADEVGEDNFFSFGLTVDQVQQLRQSCAYNPWQYYIQNPELKQALDMINSGYFSPGEPHRYHKIFNTLTHDGDYYLVMADYAEYIECQDRVDALYRMPSVWARKAILNIARMGNFSSDRAVLDYARNVWNVSWTLPGVGDVSGDPIEHRGQSDRAENPGDAVAE